MNCGKTVDIHPAVGSVGRALDRLAPSGQVEVLGTAHSARTGGETIDTGRAILVTGFDPPDLLVREATPADVAQAQLPPSPPTEVSGPTIGGHDSHGNQNSQNRPSPPTEGSGPTIGDFFLMVGAIICLLGCALAVLATVYGFWAMKQVMVGLEGLVTFCFFAALFVVFLRVTRIK
jgi:hypothetical protein